MEEKWMLFWVDESSFLKIDFFNNQDDARQVYIEKSEKRYHVFPPFQVFDFQSAFAFKESLERCEKNYV